jgi:endoglucanase
MSPHGMNRGINIGNALEAPTEGEWGVTIKDEYFKVIKDAGFDTVRIPINWSAHALKPSPYTIEPEFFNRIDHVVDSALLQGLKVIINMQQYMEIMSYPDAHKERFIAMWSQISKRYKDRSDDLSYELLSEPQNRLKSGMWNIILAEAIREIRKWDNKMIIIDTARFAFISELKELRLPENDRNLMASVHYYEPFNFTTQGAHWVGSSDRWLGTKWMGTDEEKNKIRSDLDQAMEWGKKNKRTVLLGEFGAYNKADHDSRVRWTEFVAREAEKRGLPWAYWEFCSGFGIYDPTTGMWDDKLLKALIP